MNKMNVKKWFNSPVLWAHVTVFVFIVVVLAFGLDSYAAESRDYEISDTSVSEFYGFNTPQFYTRDKILEQMSDPTTANFTRIPSTGYNTDMSIFDGSVAQGFRLLDRVGSDSIDNASAYHVFTVGSVVNSITIVPSDGAIPHVVLFGSYIDVYSSSPFKIYNIYAYSNGSYYVEYFDSFYVDMTGGRRYRASLNSADVFITDMPLNVASTDGSTGFTGENDYNISNYNEYQDFNYLMNDGFIIKDYPNYQPEVESEAKYHLTFRDSTYYSGSGLNMFWHNNNFTFTEFQINNPVYYRLKFNYRVEFANNLGVNDVYTYTPQSDVQLAYFLGQANRLNTGSRIAVPLCSDWFVNQNGQTLTSAIIGTINAVTGTDVQYINPNGLFENIIEWMVTSEQYFFGDNDGSPLQSVIPVYGGVITKFKIYGEVSLYNEVNSNYESNAFIDSHDFLSGNGEVVSTDNTVAPYEDSPNPQYTQLPSASSSGGISAGANSAIATIEKGAVSIQVNAGNGSGVGFQMPQQDWNEFGGLITEMRGDLTNLTSDNGVLSVMGAVQRVTSGILPTDGGGTPNKLWYLIYAGVAGSIAIALWNKAAHNH